MPDNVWDHFDENGEQPPTPEAVEVFELEPVEVDQRPEGVDPLGHDRGVYFYFSRSGQQVHALAASAHTKLGLSSLASVPHFYERNTNWLKPKGGIDWDAIADQFMRSCRDRGIYDPDIIRGRGAWLDNGRPVLHLGDRLVVGDAVAPLRLSGSRYIYEAARPLSSGSMAAALSNRDAHRLVEICGMLRWERKISGTLLAGFIAIAPICGGLVWRPSVWMTGPKGSGKTWAEENIIAAAIGRIALRVQSNTTEPGLRRELGSDARPVLFDEAEQEDAASSARMQAVLALIRQSSSESGGEILKAAHGAGVMRFRIRSCFALSSINIGIKHGADESRITALVLKPRDALTLEDRTAADEQFAQLSILAAQTITPAYSDALLARSVRLLPVIRKNAETFARAVSIHLGSRRLGDQIGTLLAGAFSLHTDRLISDAEAVEFIGRQQWDAEIEQAEERDEQKLLSYLTQHRMGISPSNGGRLEVTVGRMINAASGRDPDLVLATAERELRQIGIRYESKDGPRGEGIYVSASHSHLARVLTDTPWASGWNRSLERLPGADRHKSMVRFAFGHQSRATWIPWSTIEPEDIRPKTEAKAA